LFIGADAADIALTLSAALTLPRPGDVTSPPPTYNITVSGTNAAAKPIVCNGAVMGINFIPSALSIIGLRFTAAAGCIIGEGGVLFRGLNAISSSMSAFGLTDAKLVFDNADVRGPIRMTAASVQSSSITLHKTAVTIFDCSVATDLYNQVAVVLGVGMASTQVKASTVEVVDSTVSCDGPSTYSAKDPTATVGVVGVACGLTANAVTVTLTNATITSVSGVNWTQASSASHTLVGLAGIAAPTHTGSIVTARSSTFRAANFVGASVGWFVAGVGTARPSVTYGTQISVTGVDGTSVSVSNVSFSSVGKGMGGVGIVLDNAVAPAVTQSISIGLDDAAVTVENFDLGTNAAVAVGGVGLAMNYFTLRDANISVVSTASQQLFIIRIRPSRRCRSRLVQWRDRWEVECRRVVRICGCDPRLFTLGIAGHWGRGHRGVHRHCGHRVDRRVGFRRFVARQFFFPQRCRRNRSRSSLWLYCA
jgi:hypothetical protein